MSQECSRCEPVLKVAGEVMDSGIVPLSALYRKYFRSIYKSDKSIRLIQLIFRAFGQLFVTEYVKNVDFARLASCVSNLVPEKSLTSGMGRESPL